MYVRLSLSQATIQIRFPGSRFNLKYPSAAKVKLKSSAMSMERLDIVIFGASGFTGKYTVEELHRLTKYYEKNLTWGIAGRSEEKLKDVLNHLINKTGDSLQDVSVIIADVGDEASLKRMASRAKVVINCCGPYRFYGPAVVKACVEEGAHHVDVSGEPAYMENMQLKYHEAAKRAGVYVISACGFDSIPADLGVVFLQQNFKGTVNSCEAYLRTLLPPGGKGREKGSNTTFNYATWVSLINGVKELSELKAIRKELNPKRQTPLKPPLNQKGIIHKNPVDQFWYVPFPGADRPVVNRTQRFLNETYKTRPAQFQAYFGFPYMKNALSTLFVGSVISFLTKFSAGQKLLLNHPKFFTLGVITREGPSEENMKNTSFMVAVSGEGWDEDEQNVEGKAPTKTMRVEVTGVNPGYGATCTCVIYSAITLLREYHKIPGTGGVITPGAAFAKTTLIENLQKHNVNFQVVSVNKLKAKL